MTAPRRPNDVPSFVPDPTLYPFKSNWFPSNAGSVHYVDEGEGQPVLLMHGNPNWSFIYRKIIPRLTDDFRCIAPDYPGFGLSSRPKTRYGYTPGEHAAVVGELVDTLELDNLIVVGMDWGGPIGLEVASRRADRVDGLAMGGTWFWPVAGGELKKFSRLLSTPPMQLLIKRRNFFVKTLMRKALEIELSAEEFKHYVDVSTTPAARSGQAIIVQHILKSADWLAALEDRIQTELSATPITVLFGELDTKVFGSQEARAKWTNTFDNVTSTDIAGANHFLQEDAPEAVSRAILLSFAHS